MECPNCHYNNSDLAVYCTKCARKLKVQLKNQEIACRKCGQLNQPKNKYCSKCGQKLKSYQRQIVTWVIIYAAWVLLSSLAIINSYAYATYISVYIPVVSVMFIFILVPGLLLQYLYGQNKRLKQLNQKKEILLNLIGRIILFISLVCFFMLFVGVLWQGQCEKINTTNGSCSQSKFCTSQLPKYKPQCDKYGCVEPANEYLGTCNPIFYMLPGYNSGILIFLIIFFLIDALCLPIILIHSAQMSLKEDKDEGRTNFWGYIMIIVGILWMGLSVISALGFTGLLSQVIHFEQYSSSLRPCQGIECSIGPASR